MRRNLRAVAWLSMIGGTAACTSLLGDFTTSNAIAPGSDASSDTLSQGDGNVGPGTDGAIVDASEAGTTDGNTTTDAADAADAADLLLKCDGFKFASPILVDSLALAPAGLRSYSNGIGLATISQDSVRIVLRKQQSSGFTIFTINKNNPQNGSGSFDVATNVNENQFRATATGAGLLATTYNQTNELDLYTLPTTMGPTGPLPAPTVLVKPGGLPSSTNNFQANFFEIANETDVFYALTFQQPTTSLYSLQVGRATGSPSAPTELATSQKQFDNLAMLHVGASMRIFSSGDPQSGGAVIYSVPDNGIVTAPATPRAVSQSTSVPAFLLDAVQGPGPGYNVAFIELDTQSTTNAATFRVGTVDATKIDTFKANDLPLGPVFGDLALLPVDQGTTTWFGDDLVAIGKGPNGGAAGLNFIWMNASGVVRAENVGTSAILMSRGQVGSSTISPAQKLGLKYQTWNVVWTETVKIDGGDPYDVVYLNELVCH